MKKSLLLTVAMAFVAGGFLVAQEGKKISGRVPSGYGKIGLSAEQKQTIYKIQADYKSKIDVLEKQVSKLKGEMNVAIEDLLTEEQKAKLKARVEKKNAKKIAKKKDDKKVAKKDFAKLEKKDEEKDENKK